MLISTIANLYGESVERSPKDFTAAIIDKHERANQIDDPKIIFTGGSNIAFGLDSESIQNEFMVPVVNLGIDGSLGVAFMLEEVKHIMDSGDVVFISFGYLHALNGVLATKMLTSDYYPVAKNFYTITPRERIKHYLIKTRQRFIRLSHDTYIWLSGQQNPLNSIKPSIYSRSGFNQYGDFVAHLEQERKKSLDHKETFTYQYWSGIELINEFAAYAEQQDVQVYYFFGNLARSEYQKNKKVIDRLVADIHRNIDTIILGTVTDFVFDDKHFYDTVYHLHKEGRILLTEKFVTLIQTHSNLVEYIQNIHQQHYQECCEQFD